LPNRYNSWPWGLPLIMLTVVMHVFVLGVFPKRGLGVLERVAEHRCFDIEFALVLGIAVLLVTVLHALEAAAWGVVYLGFDAPPDAKTAMLYSMRIRKG
jgi:hypothetical protein